METEYRVEKQATARISVFVSTHCSVVGHDHDWAVIGASVMPGDANVGELLAKPDWLSSVTGELAQDELFRKPFTHALKALWAEGTESVLRQCLDS